MNQNSAANGQSAAGNGQQMIRVGMSSAQVAELMGISGGLGAIAFLVLQRESEGLTRSAAAEALGVSVEDIDSLVHHTCEGADQAESESIWNQGIVALRAARLMAEQMIRQGWDDVEAMAVDKLGRNLASMKGLGDADQMLRIAAAANRATRRGRGEQVDQRNRGDQTHVAVGITLQPGNLGSIRLNLSPRVQAQLQQPGRVIDVEPNQSQSMIRDSKMLSLKETRGLVAEEPPSSTLDSPDAALQEAKDSGKKYNFDFSKFKTESFGEALKHVE
jgi:hypothetical protein